MPFLYVVALAFGSLGGAGIVLGLAMRRAERRRAAQQEGYLPEAASAADPTPVFQMAAASPTVPPPAARMPDLRATPRWPKPDASSAGDFRARFPPPSPPTASTSAALSPEPPPPIANPDRYVPPPLPPPQKLTTADLLRGRKAFAELQGQGLVPTREAALPRSLRVTASVIRPEAASPARRAPSKRKAHPLKGTKYQLTYASAYGEVTERKIRLERVSEEYGILRLHAYCYLRKERREFRSDRILDMIDSESGFRVYDPVSYFGD